MKTTPITDNLTQLTKWGLVNAFLVREDDGFTLVDTTLKGSGEALLGAAQAAGAPIVRIALTHGHGDHVGSLDELAVALGSRAQVLMGDIDARIHAGEHVVEGKLKGSWPKITTVPGVRLKGGDRVGSLEVIDSPGHSPGHIAFLDTRDRTLIAGDVFATIGGPAVSSHMYWRFPLPGIGTFNAAQDLASARVLRELHPTALVVGHGKAIHDPAAAMDLAIARADG